MRHLPLLLVLTLLTPAVLADEAATAPATAPATQAAAIDEAAEKKVLHALIDQAIKLLEDKNYGELIELLAPPEEVRKMKEKGWDKVVSDFGNGRKSARMLTTLKAVRGTDPVFKMLDSGPGALFLVENPDENARGSIEFAKIDGTWRIPR